MICEVDFNYWRGVVDYFRDFEPLPVELQEKLQERVKANELKAKKILEKENCIYYGK